MQYEETEVQKPNKKAVKNYQLDKLDTSTMLWHIVKRHKFGLVATWAVVITILYLFPFVPDLIVSAIKGF